MAGDADDRPALAWTGRRFTWRDGDRHIHHGPGVLDEAPGLLDSWAEVGFALLTTPRAAVQAPAVIAAAAVVRHVPHGPVPEAAAAVLGRTEGRPVVALGGGRVIDAAKAVAAVDGVACAALPTSLSGAELTRGHRLPAGRDTSERTRPTLVLIDPLLAASQPTAELAAGAMNALAHAVEALYARPSGPVVEAAALDAAALIATGLADAEPDRDALALGSLLAAYAMDATGFAVHHVLSQTVVRLTGSPHAQTNAVLLPHTVALMEQLAPRELRGLARALDGDRTTAPASLAVRRLAGRARVSRLRDLGVATDALDGIAAAAARRPELAATPQTPTEATMRALLAAAW